MSDRWRNVQIENVLSAELSRAEGEARRARLRLREILKEVPSGIPAPDSSLLIAEASAESKRAHAAWQCALERWKAFVTTGTVPADLQDPQPLPIVESA